MFTRRKFGQIGSAALSLAALTSANPALAATVLPVDPRGILKPGGPQTIDPNNFVVPNGLVGYWGFDADCLDLAQNLAFDLSGNNNTGILSGTPKPSFADGQVANALSFDGANSYVSCGTSSSLRPPQITMTAWINPTVIGTRNTIFSNGDSGAFLTNNYELGITSTNNKLIFYGRTPALQITSNNAAVATGIWSFVAATFNGTVVTFYSNGQPWGTTTCTIGMDNAYGLYIGLARSASVNVGYFNGRLDDLRIYNRALDPWEVIALYKAGLAGRRDAGDQMPATTDMPML